MSQVRELRESDLGPLHRIYSTMIEGIPHHARVNEEQFSRQLTTFCQPGVADSVGENGTAAFVAECAGQPVALALTAILSKPHSWEGLAQGTGALRWLLAPPKAQVEARAVIAAAVAHLKERGAAKPLACHYIFGPAFHNTGCAMLPAAWPWLGHWLYLEGFRARGSEIRMRKPMLERPEPIALPEGSELREHHSEHTPDDERQFTDDKHLYIDGKNAAQCHNSMARKYVPTSDEPMVYTNWLGVDEKFRGLGLGRKMLRQAVVTAFDGGARVATLTTAGMNFRAQALYVDEGYVQTDTMWDFELREAPM